MAWKCKICRDRGAVMGLNHPEVCECQKNQLGERVYNEHLEMIINGKEGEEHLQIEFPENHLNPEMTLHGAMVKHGPSHWSLALGRRKDNGNTVIRFSKAHP